MMAKLASTSECVIALVFLITNLEKKRGEAFGSILMEWI